MLEEVKQYGLEKFAGDENLANDFVEGFINAALEKAAAEGIDVQEMFKEAAQQNPMGPVESLQKGFAENIGKGVGSLGINLITTGLMMGLRNIEAGTLHTAYLKALEQAVAGSRILRETDRAKVNNFGATIARFAPHIATDPHVLASVLSNAVHGDSIDPMTIKTLTDLEGRYRENHGFTPKQYV